jgi:hypothetical protein
MQQGGSVLLAGVRCTIQYVSSKGMLDLKGEDGEVHYGVDPASVELIKAPPAIPAAGSYVQLDGVRCKVQYVSSKGQLDLKGDDGAVHYGIDPASVSMSADQSAPAEITAGCTVRLDGTSFKVQYVSSKGQLDLKSLDGEVVQYGVDPATVTMEQALAAAPAPETAPRQYASNYGNNALMGTSITLWEGGRGLMVTVVEVDNDSGKNMVRALSMIAY